VEAVAHEAGQLEFFGEDAKKLMARTHYLQPVPRRALAFLAAEFSLRRPLAFLRAFLLTILCRYGARKSPALDLEVFARALHFATVLEAKAIQHLHAPWASLDAFVALVSARLLGIPYSVQARAYDIHRYSSTIGFEIKLCHAAFVVTNSNYNESAIRSRLSENPTQKVYIIYDGIDLDRFGPCAYSSRSGKTVRILSGGNLVEPKGFEYLILACKLLKERGYGISCEIVGGRVASETNYHIKILKLHNALDMNEIVFFGRQSFDYVLKKYEAADIFVLPAVTASHAGRDITPNVLMEAMAMKLPVVTTRSGAIPEVVENGVSGILVPPRDEQALAEALSGLIENDALRETLGRNVRKRVEKRFDINKNVAEFVTLFGQGSFKPMSSCVTSMM